MRERVAKLVGMNRRDSRLVATPTQHDRNTRIAHGAEASYPKRTRVAVNMPNPHTEIPIERHSRLPPEGTGALPTSLPEHERDLLVEIEVVDRHPQQFPAPHARVDEQTDDR